MVLRLLVLALVALAACSGSPRTTPSELPTSDPIAAIPASAPPSSGARRGDLVDSARIPVGHSPLRGPPRALVTVVEFGDFECRFCGRVQPTLRALREHYGDAVRWVWKNEPLTFHAHALGAAEAAMEVFAQQGPEGFWRFHDLAFANPRALERGDLEGYATQLGVDLVRFRAALDGHTHLEAINADIALAAQLDVRGTPAFAINGTLLVGARPEAEFRDLIDRVLARARTIAPPERVYDEMVADPVPPPERVAPAPPRYAVTTAPDAPSRGPEQAPVVIQLFSDFQCPFCARVRPTLETVLAAHPDVRLEWRDFPLPFHGDAMLAAEAGREVFAQRGAEAFWRFADDLFDHQQALDRAHLEAYALHVGRVDMARFRAALDDHRHRSHIQADIDAANATGAALGTPAFFVNGYFRAGAMPAAELERLIERARSSSGSPAPPMQARGESNPSVVAVGAW